MTDKQIIIDDCIHLDEWNHCDICEKLIKTKDGANGKKREHLLIEEDLRCDFYPNCYYKQLKAKEQECKQLREIMHKDFCTHYVLGECSQDHHDNCVGRNQCIKDLEQECEQKKAELELFKTSNQTTIDQLKKENDALFKAIEEVNKINKKLESENEDLKKSILQECPNCGEEYLNYKGAALYSENSDLKQTLAEIKEIINEFAKEDILTFPDFSKEKNYELIQKQCGEPILKILQKIDRMNLSVELDEARSTATSLNEVEDVNNNR